MLARSVELVSIDNMGLEGIRNITRYTCRTDSVLSQDSRDAVWRTEPKDGVLPGPVWKVQRGSRACRSV